MLFCECWFLLWTLLVPCALEQGLANWHKGVSLCQWCAFPASVKICLDLVTFTSAWKITVCTWSTGFFLSFKKNLVAKISKDIISTKHVPVLACDKAVTTPSLQHNRATGHSQTFPVMAASRCSGLGDAKYWNLQQRVLFFCASHIPPSWCSGNVEKEGFIFWILEKQTY